MITKLFPCIQIAISIGAAIVYGWQGDWKHALYWASATFITISVTI